MLEFRPIRTEDYDIAAPIMRGSCFRSAESSFVDLYMWSEVYNTQICIDGETVFFKTGKADKTSFLFPFGGDLKSALLKIRSFAGSVGLPVVFIAVTETMKNSIESLFPNEFRFCETRDYFDYVYNSSDLIKLEGKKYHQKRNHVNKFLKICGSRFSYEKIDESNISEVRDFQDRWLKTALDNERDDILKSESVGINRVLDNMHLLDIKGGLIRIDGKVCAYSLGTLVCNDTLGVMVEKGDYSFPGIYQIMNKLFAEHNGSDMKYVNREDDAGSEGLRHAKLSYYPEILLKKYKAIWEI